MWRAQTSIPWRVNATSCRHRPPSIHDPSAARRSTRRSIRPRPPKLLSSSPKLGKAYENLGKARAWLDYTVKDSDESRDAAHAAATLGVLFAKASKEAEYLRAAGGLRRRTLDI